jgi:hypothetical protein
VADIITLTQLKDYLHISGTGKDGHLSLVVAGVNALIERVTGREWARALRSGKRYVGNDTSRLVLKHYPMTMDQLVVSIDGVSLNVTDPNVLAVDLENAVLIRVDGNVWPRMNGKPAITVTYTGGPLTVPNDLTLAALEIGAWVYRANGARASLSVGGMSQTMWQGVVEQMPTAAAVLMGYSDSARGYVVEI